MNPKPMAFAAVLNLTAFICAFASMTSAVAAEVAIPSQEELSKLDSEELIRGFGTALLSHSQTKSFAAAEAYLWALRFRFPDLPRLGLYECHYAREQLLCDYGDRQKARDCLKRFLPGGPYANSKQEADYLARRDFATDAYLDGRVDEAVNACRHAVVLNDGEVTNFLAILDCVRLIYDLRLLRDESSASGDLAFSQTELGRLADAATAEINRAVPSAPGQPEPEIVTAARRIQILANRRLLDCVDAVAPAESASRLRADACSYFRLADHALSLKRPESAAIPMFKKAVESGRRWMALQRDSDLPRNLSGMQCLAISIARVEKSKAAYEEAYSLLNTVWSYRRDPAAAEAEPWRAIIWLNFCGSMIGQTRDEQRVRVLEALADGEHLGLKEYQHLFQDLSNWAGAEGDQEGAYLYLRDFGEFVGDLGPKRASIADNLPAQMATRKPELAAIPADHRSDAFTAMKNANKISLKEGKWRLAVENLTGEE